MKRHLLNLLAATAIGVVACQAASAADIVPRKAPPPAPPPAPIWNWTGFYFGGNLGVGITRDQFSVRQGPDIFTNKTPGGFFADFGDALSNQGIGSHTGVGPEGGFQLGYNYQVPNSSWVFGIEGEFDFADLKGDHQNSFSQTASANGIPNNFELFGVCPLCVILPTASSNFSASANEQLRLASRVKDIALITARFGIASGPQDRTLWYVKGGGAWARTDYSASFNSSSLACVTTVTNGIGGPAGLVVDPTGCASGSNSGFASGSSSRWGWTVGTGVEWGLWDNWSAKIEYDFLDFGTKGITLTDSSGDVFNINDKQQIHQVKVGLNYRFNWGGGYGGY